MVKLVKLATSMWKAPKDCTCEYSHLDLFAQSVSVDADNMAREYQEKYDHQARPYALMTKHTGAYLVVWIMDQQTLDAEQLAIPWRSASNTRIILTTEQWWAWSGKGKIIGVKKVSNTEYM